MTKTITLHYAPIIIGLMIFVTVGFSFGLTYTAIGYLTSEHVVVENSITECHQHGCNEWIEASTKYCSFDLVKGLTVCQYNDPTHWWLLGLILTVTFSSIWFIFLFMYINDKKKFVSVRWVE